MARNITTIQNQIETSVRDNPTLSNLTSTSQTAIWRLWAFIVATSQAQQEQLNDQFLLDVENVANRLAPGTLTWIQNQALLFQYNATITQIIKFDETTFTPYYETINTNFRIISNCSVSNGNMNTVNIKVAKGTTTTPSPLSTDELAAFQFYMNQIKPAGIIYNCISVPSDKLRTKATIYFQGAYSSIIQSNLKAAYDNYLQNIGFGGKIKLVDIIIALKSVEGVNDVIINDMRARSNATAFGSGYSLVTSNTVSTFPEYTTVAGYIVDETTASNSFIDLLTLISQ